MKVGEEAGKLLPLVRQLGDVLPPRHVRENGGRHGARRPEPRVKRLPCSDWLGCSRLALVLVLWLASPALAQEGLLIAATKGQTKIPVWRSVQAQDDGEALLGAKADSALVLPLLSCIAEPGTRVVIGGYDPGLYRRGVILIDGQAKGCRGIVDARNFKWKELEATPKKSYPPPDCRKPGDQWTGEKCVRGK